MRMIFVNLPVKDLEAAKRFYAGLGFALNPQFSTDDCASFVIEENIVAMLLTEARFRDFITGDIADTAKGKEALICLSAGSRAEVDETLAKALAAGGQRLDACPGPRLHVRRQLPGPGWPRLGGDVDGP
jgi:uncharacterized protein